MTKRISLFFFVFCFLFSYTVCAQDKIKIFYNRKEVNTDVNAFIENSRTLIPVVMLTKMGYKTEWNEKKQTVKIYKSDNSTGSNITLTIGSNIAVVNSKTVLMDVKAKIYNDRTYVPIRFISENFGYNVSWEDSTRSVYITDNTVSEKYSTITKISVNRENDNIAIKLYTDSEFAKVEKFTLTDPLRYVFDIKDTVLDIPQGSQELNSSVATLVRYSQYTSSPKVVRLVIDAQKECNITYKYVDSVFTIFIEDKENASIKNITQTKSGNTTSFKISTNRDLSYTTYKLSNPTRYYVEFEKADINLNNYSYSDDIVSKVATVTKNDVTQVIFYLNGIASQSKCNFYKKNGMYCVDITKNTTTATPKNDKLIVIDPGHGGDEPGSLGKIDGKIVLYEKDVNLKIATVAYNKLLEEGYNVIATRTDDSTVSLQKRVEIANESNASLFVSVHNNSFEESSAKGTLTMYAYDDTEANANVMTGYKLAKTIQPFISEATQSQDRGLLRNPKIYVLAKTAMPAALVECLFISNEEDLEKLMDGQYIEKMGIAIANGIKMAVKQLE